MVDSICLRLTMTDCMLPASPNWYCSRVIDTNDKGILCFGAKHSIYILDTTVHPPKFQGKILAHDERVVGLSFCTAGEQNKLCSISEDGRVKIWNLEDGCLLSEHAEHTEKITSVHWSPVNHDLIVSGDDKGGLIIWHPASGEMKNFFPERNAIFCLTCSPHVANHVAVGYKNGHVILLDVNKKAQSSILQRFKGHDDEIHCIVWCPQQGSELQWKCIFSEDGSTPENTDSYLLASSSKDKTIRVWNVGQNKPVCVWKLPQPTQRRGWEDAKQRLWVTLCWLHQKSCQIVSSSFNGELLLWDLEASKKQQPVHHFHGKNGCCAHTKIVFNIALAGNNSRGLCSISMDRNVILWEIDSLNTTYVIPCCGGCVYCMALSPIHPGRLAAGVGDNQIRVWNVENSQRAYDVNVYWQGMKAKVTAICWHPVKEGELAFGTEDGKVGILDILSSRSQISGTYHNRTVYVVKWGPPSYTTDNNNFCDEEYVLYSCGDSTVLQHNPKQLQNNALCIDNVIRHTNKIQGKLPRRSEISWKPDYSVVALGNEDGTIEIFKVGNLEILCSVQIHRKLINIICWHPEYTNENVAPSPCQFWIASGSNEAVIHVTDLKKSLELSEKSDNREPVIVTESFCRLEGHKNKITGLSWSPHSEGLLVSASFDWTAQVWDVKRNQPVANHRAHHGRIHCVVWSGLDPDVVYTGSDDFAIHCWRISQQLEKVPPVGSEKRKHKNRSKTSKSNLRHSTQSQAAVCSMPQSEGQSLDVNEIDMTMIQTLLNQKRKELQHAAKGDDLPAGSPITSELGQLKKSSEDTHLAPAVNDSAYPKAVTNSLSKWEPGRREMKDKKKRKMRSLFPLSSTLENRGKLQTQDDCVLLAQAKAKDFAPLLPSELCHLGHFLNRDNTYQLFDNEINHHTSHDNWEQYIILETFRGNVGDSVRTLADKHELNDFSVALSAMASPSTWWDTCQVYASQLEKEGNYTKAATYLLAVHKVYDAISLLKRNGLYKDALCLALVRLSPEDTVIKSLYSSWGDQLAADGNYEHAAKCYIASDQPVQAARLLARRADTSALRVATEICISCQDIGNAKIYCHKYVQQCLLNLDWASAAQLVERDITLKLYGLLIVTHQSLLQQLHLLGYLQDMDIDNGETYSRNIQQNSDGSSNKTTMPWLALNTSSVKSWLPWKPYSVGHEIFLHYLIRQWYCLWDLDMTRNSLKKLDQELTALSYTRQAQTGIKEVLIEITCYVMMSIIKIMLSEDDEAAKWMTIAMATCYDQNLDDIWEGLCRLLLPTGSDGFDHFCQEIRALQLSAIPQENVSIDHVVMSADQKHHSCIGQLPMDTDILRIYNDNVECSPNDCLKAFYNLRVLKYYLAEENCQKYNADVVTASVEPSLLCIQELAHSLLWNIQMYKLMLQESLQQISKAMTTLSGPLDNVSSLNMDTFLAINCESEDLIYPVTPEIKDVSLAAFHKENEIMQSRQNNKCHVSGQDSLPETEDKYVTMQNLDGECDEDKSIQMSSAVNCVSVSTLVAHNCEGVENQLTTVMEHHDSKPKNHSAGKYRNLTVDMPEVDKLRMRHQIYPGIPEEWYTLPIQEKYKQTYIDLKVLTVEQAFMQNELSRLNEKLKNIPFPDPEKSAMLLIMLCNSYHKDGGSTLLEAIRKWAEQHCFTNSVLNFFLEFKSEHE